MSAIDRLWRRVENVVGFGRTTSPTVESGTVARVQHKMNDITSRDDVPVVFHFGFAACLPMGTDTVTVHVQGSSSNGVIVATNHQPSRPTGLKVGEAMMYNQAGDHVYLRQGGVIEVKSSVSVQVDSPAVHFTGSLTVDGDVTASGVSLVHHDHPDPQGGVTGPPQ